MEAFDCDLSARSPPHGHPPHRIALAFTRGPQGWTRSVVGVSAHADYGNLAEHDELDVDPYDNMLCDAGNYTSHKVPLHEQDALESLAAPWAREWDVGYPYAALPWLGPDDFQLPPIQASDITCATLLFPLWDLGPSCQSCAQVKC